MVKHRFFVKDLCAEQGELLLDNRNSHKIMRVLRLQAGTEILVGNAQGREFRAVIASIEGGRVAVKILEETAGDPESQFKVTLVQAVAKGERFEWILQKAVEIGVQAVQPLITEHTVVRFTPEKSVNKTKRWQLIAEEAARQSRRVYVPRIGAPLPLPLFWERVAPEDLNLFLWEGQAQPLKNVLLERDYAKKDVNVLIGPEGGFSKRELQEALDHGAFGVSLGPRILRTDTAGLVALSIILYEWGDLGGF